MMNIPKHWLDHINGCAKSGAEMSAYAKEHSLNLKQFYQMKYQLKKDGFHPQDSRKSNIPAFSKVTVKASPLKEQQVKSLVSLFLRTA